ncbi:hypothetical protein APHDU1_0451 [Anaplasma phagocytophilum]|nr:hypothetical protein APHDU1_0451 [Anaplasma phagocytophilum]
MKIFSFMFVSQLIINPDIGNNLIFSIFSDKLARILCGTGTL